MNKKNDEIEMIPIIDEAENKKTEKPKRKGPKSKIVEHISEEKLELDEVIDDLNHEDVDNKKRLDVAVERYNPDPKIGLTTTEVEARQQAGLINRMNSGSTKTIGKILFSNIVTFFNILTFAIGIWLWSIGQWQQTMFILIVTINIVIGIGQEIKAKKIIDKLALLAAPTAIVIRDESEQEINISDVVIDDILYLKGGKQITVDAVVKEGVIEVNESLLTGESDPIIKKSGDTLYSGSFVISGTCHAQTTAIGKDIYINKISAQAKVYKKPKSALLKSLKTIIRIIGIFIIPIGFGLFYNYAFEIGTWNFIPENYHDAVTATAGAMIGMIPSGLFLLTSLALLAGVVKLARNKALVQELYCIEMLARVDTLCLDKTGTITDGTMTVKSVIEYDGVPGLTLKNIVSAMLNAQNEQNLTSAALLERFGNSKRIRHKELIAFSSSRKYSAVEFEKYGTFVIGAPEFVLKKDYHKIAVEVERQAGMGYRVLAVAAADKAITNNEVTGNLKLLALIMIEDTIRPDAIETINYFKQSGVDVKVISGDNPITVARISQRAGIERADQYISLEGLSDKEVIRAAEKYQVFGRVNPHQKKLLVQALKNVGRTVAMTGDGVNDILALKEADTSIAMASGSEAAINVSHLVLLDSNFSSMPKVVMEGRRVINNIERVTSLFLVKTVFTLLLSIISLIMQWNYPITPIQLNIIEIFVIGIPSFVLALEANNKRVEGRFLWNVIKNALPGALVIVINSLIIFGLADALALEYSSREISTLVVLTATFTSFMVLLKISLPFNTRRRLLFLAMSTMAVMIILLSPNVFDFAPLWHRTGFPADFTPLTLPQILLMIVLMQASFPMIYIISNIYRWIKTLAKKTVDTIADTN